MKIRSLAPIVASTLVAVALTLAGCGEKSEPPTSGPVVTQTTTGGGGGSPQPTTTSATGGGGQPATDEEKIKTTVMDFLVKPNDPSVCDVLITPRFLKQSYGNRQGCVSARKPSALANGVIVQQGPVKNGSVVVTAQPQGGVFGGETLKVTVVRVGNSWRIDRISSNAPVGP